MQQTQRTNQVHENQRTKLNEEFVTLLYVYRQRRLWSKKITRE
jgi:hypothetical protein